MRQLIAHGIALFLTAGVAFSADLPSVKNIIREKGELSFVDGSSVFTFQRDGQFSLRPVLIGESGRTIDGVWTADSDGMFVITGRWGWLNGASKVDDFRQMKIFVSLRKREPIGQGSAGPVKRPTLYDVYFTIDSLEPVSAEKYKKTMESRTSR